MYLGVRSYEDALACHDYETARRSLERASLTPKLGRKREPKAFGYHMGRSSTHGVTWVRECTDKGYEGAIAFRLYNTDVVIWHPDNSVEIDNFGTETTSAFARAFLPSKMSLYHTTKRCGELGGHKGVGYYDGEEWRLCWGGLPRFRLHDNVWLPDEDTLDEVRFPELSDRKVARAVSAKYHLKDFDTWLSMAPMHIRIEHDCWDIHDCADALLKRDFALAAMFLPLTYEPRGFGTELNIIPIVTRRHGAHITTGALAKLKLALWDLEGLIETVSFKTIASSEFARRMRRVRAMQQLGLCARDMGPPRW